MDFDSQVKSALTELINDGTFEIKKIVYDDKNFGNSIVEICSYKNLNIRFVKDKGDVSCEIGKFGEWYWIDDVFSIIGVKARQIEKDMIDAISNTSAQIKPNLPSVFKVFDEKNISVTKKKLKSVATKRVMGLF